MKPTSNDKLIAYLALFSGLGISGVAEFYSIMGLIAIYPAAFWPIVIMGVVLGLGKLTGTVWLKQNWENAPFFLKTYLLPAVVFLMLITSIGVFGFLSKAHSDQSLVSGDVQSKIGIYDEKIKTAKENIEADRKQLKQMDEAVDQVMARSTTEGGADKANAIRKSQQRDRGALAKDIEANQKLIASLNDEAAPIRAEVRKVEAEVGPIKYIAAFIYGDNPDSNVLEKAVTWVSILIVVVLDPMAVILLLASQYSFQRIRESENPEEEEFFDRAREVAQDLDSGTYVSPIIPPVGTITSYTHTTYEPDDGALTDEQVELIRNMVKDELPSGKVITKESLFEEADIEEPTIDEEFPFRGKGQQPGMPMTASYAQPSTKEVTHAYLDTTESFYKKPEGWVTLPPMVYTPEETVDFETQDATTATSTEIEVLPETPIAKDNRPTFDFTTIPEDQEYVMINGQNMHIRAAKTAYRQTPKDDGYVQNEEQKESGNWNRVISEAEYRDRVVKIYKHDSQDNPSNPA